MIDIKQALDKAIETLLLTSPSPRLDAELLLINVLKTSRTYLYAYPEFRLNSTQQQAYQTLINKRVKGVPIAYLTGTREFWSMPLLVNEHTLIPRPDTERLVELTLALFTKTQAKILDAGTGSGAIALALASERPEWEIMACDKQEEAIDMAKRNATELSLHNINFFCSNWFNNLPNTSFDVIVSNPPYIAENDPHLSEGDLRFEPKGALVSGEDGLVAIRYLVKNSYERLLPNGLLLLEHGFSQAAAVTRLLKQGGYRQVQSWLDLQGHTRVSGGWRV